MTKVEISIVGAKATAKKTGVLTSGMVGVPVSFVFDQCWDGLNIIPVFSCGDITKDNGLKNNQTTIPYEVLQYAGNELYIGAEGRSNDGKLVIPTVWARIGHVHQGARATGDMGLEPTPMQFDRFMAEIEKTDEKVTKAIEEVIATGALKGEQGNPGTNGKDGVDGVSATHSWNGTVLTVTSASGTSSADLKGDKGDVGANGNDYVLTDADKAEIALQAAALVPSNSVQADWMATKEAIAGDAVCIPEQTISGSLWSNLQMSLQPGFVYDVTLNGEVYVCDARADGSGVVLGNNTSLTLNGYPFCIRWAGGTATSGMFFKSSDISAPVTLKVTDHTVYIYNQMPEEYLPDCVVKSVNGETPDAYGNVEIKVGGGVDVTAEVGQTIVVEEVDANGKPTKWKAAEYQPRTHWSKEIVVLEETTIVPTDDGSLMFAPLCVPSVGATCKITYNGTEYICEVADGSAFNPGAVMMGNVDLLTAMGDTGEPFVLVIAMIGDGGGMLIPMDESESFVLSIKAEAVTKMPVKYIPDEVAAYAPYYLNVFKGMDDADNEVWRALETPAMLEAMIDAGRQVIVKMQPPNLGTIYLQFFQDIRHADGKRWFGFAGANLALQLTPYDDGFYIGEFGPLSSL